MVQEIYQANKNIERNDDIDDGIIMTKL